MSLNTLPRLPFFAHPLRLRNCFAGCLIQDLICGVLALHDLQTQPLRDMEGNVAVNKPGAWVVQFESYDYVAIFGHENDVATRWVDTVAANIWGVTIIPRFCRLFEEGEVVAVKMNLGGIESLLGAMTKEIEQGGTGTYRMCAKITPLAPHDHKVDLMVDQSLTAWTVKVQS